jgi:nitroreductase
MREGVLIHDIIRQRRTVHEYADRPLPEGLLARALETALSAPNHGLTEPWRFVRVGPETRRLLIGIGVELATKSGREPLSALAQARLIKTVINPAELVVVSQVLDADASVREEDYAAVACAIQNLMLALWAEGVGSKWSTEDVMSHPRVYSALGLQPAEQRIVGLLWIGYAARDDLPKARRRKSLSHVLRVLP